jgi:hypothetical protein
LKEGFGRKRGRMEERKERRRTEDEIDDVYSPTETE